MLTFRKCHNLQNSLLIIKKVFICCYSAGQIQNKKLIREYLKRLKRQPPVLATPLVNLALGATYFHISKKRYQYFLELDVT